MTNNYTSPDELFHFVGRGIGEDSKKYEILLKILNDGVISHPPHNNDWGNYGYSAVEGGDILKGELVIPNMVCFADIPREHLSIHMAKYSHFGISIQKEIVYKCGGRPVMYFPYWNDAPPYSIFGKGALEELSRQFRFFDDKVKEEYGPRSSPRSRYLGERPENIVDAIDDFYGKMAMDFYAFTKPFNVTLSDEHPDNYYMEREWRKIGNLKFAATNVCRIIVPADFVDRAKAELPYFSEMIESA